MQTRAEAARPKVARPKDTRPRGTRPKTTGSSISRTKLLSAVLAVAMLVSMLVPTTTSFADPIVNVPTVVTGRVLTPDMTGDTSDWIEIAQNGDYSLIVRKDFINVNPNAGTNNILNYQYVDFGSTPSYTSSIVRTKINDWFNGTAAGAADKLPTSAPLRDYTVQNTALSAIGTCCEQISLSDGYSKPTTNLAKTGSDVAFALSYTESAQFLSIYHFMRGPIANQPSNAKAVANYLQVNIPNVYIYCMWLRSVGDVPNTAAALGPNQGVYNGRVFQNSLISGDKYTYGFVFPALWVDSSIFKPTIIVDPLCTVTVRHLDAKTGEAVAPEETHLELVGPYGPYGPQDIRFYEAGVLAPYSDPAEGTLNYFGEEKTITYLYTRGFGTIIVIHLDLANNFMLAFDTYTVEAGYYGPYQPRIFEGYGAGTPLPISDPITGTIDVGQTITIYIGYQRETVTVNIIHMTPTTILWTETFTLPKGSYGPYYPFVFPGYAPGKWNPSSDEPSGATNAAGTIIDVIFVYEPL